MAWSIKAICALAMLMLTAAAPPTPGPANARAQASGLAEAFENAQLASLSLSAIGLNAVVARSSRGEGSLAALERKREILRERIDRAARAFEAALGQATPEAQARRDRAALERQTLSLAMDELERDIKLVDPVYWDLIRPDALPLKTVQGLLNPDEALLFVFTFETATYSFAVTNESAAWHRSIRFSEQQLTRTVARLRDGIAREVEGNATLGNGYRLADAFPLWKELIEPLDPTINKKKRLIAFVSGPLAALPLQALPISAGEDLETAQWLGDRYVISALPSIASLQTQRCLVPIQRHSGCNPAISAVRSRATSRGATLMLTGFGDPAIGPPVSETSPAPSLSEPIMDGPVANRSVLMQLPSLTGTRQELMAVAAVFGPAQSRIFLADQATERTVRRELDTAFSRFVIFSTHGLLGSEVGVPGESGLVLTPPPQGDARAEDDGLLTASEVAQLKFGGASIILSACNTATVEDGASGRNLQSLARAFQYGGARTVIASHWNVSDFSTAQLMSAFFTELKSSPGLPQDEAMQRAEISVKQNAKWRSPAFWAPFSLFGIS